MAKVTKITLPDGTSYDITNSCEFIIGTVSGNTYEWLGATRDTELYDGKEINYLVPSNNASYETTFTITTSSGISITNSVYSNDGNGYQRRTSEYGSGDVVHMVYTNLHPEITGYAWLITNSYSIFAKKAGYALDAFTVNGHTVDKDVPADAVFTDHTYIAGDNITIENNVISASISAPEPEIPIAYRILEYAQSDGAAWIDTGVTINDAYTLKEELSVPQGKIGAAMVAHYDQNMRQGFMVFNTSSHKIARFWPSVAYADIPVNSNINLGNKFSVIQNSSSITVIQGSYSTTATYDGGTGTDTKTIHLLHSDNPNHESYMNGTLYSAQILNSSDCVLNMVPVQRKSDNVVGMFDKVSKTFFDSDGTGVFLAGPIVDENTGGPDLSTKMDKTNPTGTGMFSMNRKAGSAAGDYSFAEGMDTTASGNYSHAEGFATIAAGDCQHVSGKYNIEDTNGEYLVIVGNGTGDTSRSNAVAIKDDGSLVLAGGVTFTPADLQALYNLIHPTT